MKRWRLAAFLFLCACGDPAASSQSAPPAASTAMPAGSIAAPLAANPSDPKRKLAISLVRRASGDLVESRAGDDLAADARRAMDDEAKAACAKQDPIACTLHGALTDGPSGDPAVSSAAFVQACTGGDMLACARLALDWTCFHPESRLLHKTQCPDDLKGWLVARSLATDSPTSGLEGARALGQKACDAGEPVGCFAVGQSWEEAAEDRKRSYPLYERACELGSYAGCERAVHNARQSIDDDKAAQAARKKWGPKALEMLLPGCEAKNVQICAQIAAYYEGGWGIPADMPQAKVYHLKACELGLKESCDRAKMFK